MGARTERQDGLRVLHTGGKESAPLRRPRARTLAVVSGKGGVGKTTLVVNLAVALQGSGKRVLVIDGDLGMGNVDLLLGQVPRHTMHDVVLGECSAEEILLTTPEGIRLMPGASGVPEMANLDDLRCERLLCSVSDFDDETDLILVDTAPGLNRTAAHLARAASEIILVTTPEPTACINSYAALRALRGPNLERNCWIVVNQAADAAEAKAAAGRIRSAAKAFLNFAPEFLGFIYDDPAVGQSVRRQQPLLLSYPSSPAAGCIRRLAAKLIAPLDPEPAQAWDRRIRRKRVANMEDAPA